MAEIQGTRGKLAVKIGSAMDSPAGYTNAQIVASGNGYCVWSTTEIDIEEPDQPDQPIVTPPADGNYTIYYDNAATNWGTVYTWIWDDNDNGKNYTGDVWPGAVMTKDAGTGYYKYSFSCTNATPKLMCIFNPGGDNGKTADLELVNNGVYNSAGYTGKVIAAGIGSVAADDFESAEYYNLQGARVTAPRSGEIYIVVRGGSTTKELYR